MPGEFLTVSGDICLGNMAQKHYPGSSWTANLCIHNEELHDKPVVPKPFPHAPKNAIPRPRNYYDDALRPWSEDPIVTVRREKYREWQIEEDAAREAFELRAEARKRAKEWVGQLAEEDKGKGKARADDGPKHRKVQWAEQIATHYLYSRGGSQSARAVFKTDWI